MVVNDCASLLHYTVEREEKRIRRWREKHNPVSFEDGVLTIHLAWPVQTYKQPRRTNRPWAKRRGRKMV